MPSDIEIKLAIRAKDFICNDVTGILQNH